MITLTIIKKLKNSSTYERKLKLYHSMDKAKKDIQPIVTEMRRAEKLKVNPSVKIQAVSYDTESEKKMLLELGAIKTNENSSKDY